MRAGDKQLPNTALLRADGRVATRIPIVELPTTETRRALETPDGKAGASDAIHRIGDARLAFQDAGGLPSDNNRASISCINGPKR